MFVRFSAWLRACAKPPDVFGRASNLSDVPRRHGEDDSLVLVADSYFAAFSAVRVAGDNMVGLASAASADAIGIAIESGNAFKGVKVRTVGQTATSYSWNWTPGQIINYAANGKLTAGPGVRLGRALSHVTVLVTL